MRKIFINERQAKILREAMDLHNSLSLTNMPILGEIRSREFALADNPCFPVYNKNLLAGLALEEYERLVSNFSDDITSRKPQEIASKLSKLITIAQEKERENKEALEKIAYNTLVDLFSIPEDCIDIDIELEEAISPDKQFHITPDTGDVTYSDTSEIEMEAMEVDKRHMMNAIVMGATTELMDIAMKEAMKELFDIDEELPHLYSRIIKISDYLNFIYTPKIDDKNHSQGGYVDISLGSDVKNALMEAHGICFPILMHEAIRGLLELCASNGLPDDMEQAKYILDKSDALINEPWNKRFGPSIWRKIVKNNEIDTNDIPYIISGISKLDTDTFFHVFKEIVAGTSTGDELLGQMIDKIRRDKDYGDFEDDMLQKQSDTQIISDSYFSDDEIAEWDVDRY